MPGYRQRVIGAAREGLGFLEDFSGILTTTLNLANTGFNAYSKITELDNAKRALKNQQAELAAHMAEVQALRDATAQQAKMTGEAVPVDTSGAVAGSAEWIPGIPNWGVAAAGVALGLGVVYVATKKKRR